MFKRLKRSKKNQHKITKGHIHYGAFGHVIPAQPRKSKTKSLMVSKKSINNSHEYQLAKALSEQMHQALDTMQHQLNEREAQMEERFIRLSPERNTINAAPKSKKGFFIIAGILAAITMIYMLYIMQSMQISMQSMSGDIKGMTQDITHMSANTHSMANNMHTMNQGVSGMNQQMGTISDSIEPMGDVAQNVSPFAKMFNQFSPF